MEWNAVLLHASRGRRFIYQWILFITFIITFKNYLTVLKSGHPKSFRTLQKLNVFVVTYLMHFAVTTIILAYQEFLQYHIRNLFSVLVHTFTVPYAVVEQLQKVILN